MKLSAAFLILLGPLLLSCSKAKVSPPPTHRTVNYSCGQLPLGSEKLNPALIRKTVECFNGGGQLNSIHQWLNQISDQELTPIAEQLNKSFLDRPDRMYALKTLFDQRLPKDDPDSALSHVAWILEDQEANRSILNIIHKIDWESILDVQFGLEEKDISTALSGVRYWYESKIHKDFLQQTSLKLTSPDTIKFIRTMTTEPHDQDVQRIYDLVLKTRAHEKILQALQLQQNAALPTASSVHRLNQMAHLTSMMLEPAFFSGLRDALGGYRGVDISCFDGNAKIKDPVRWLLDQLPRLNSTRQHRMLLFMAKPFCNAPTRCSKDLDLMDRLIENPGYSLVQGPLYSLINSNEVLDLVQTRLAKDFADLFQKAKNKDHAILMSAMVLLDEADDLSQMESVLKRLSVSGAAKLLYSLKNVDENDWKSLFSTLDRIHSDENLLGQRTAQIAFENWFNTKEHPLFDFAKEWLDEIVENPTLRNALLSALKKPGASEAAANASSLIKNGTLEDVLKQVNLLLQRKIQEGEESGALTFVEPTFKKTKRLGWSVLDQPLPTLASNKTDSCADVDLNWDWSLETANGSKFDALRRCLRNIPEAVAAGEQWNQLFVGKLLQLIPGMKMLDGPFAEIDLRGLLQVVRQNLKHLGSQKGTLIQAQTAFTPLYQQVRNMPAFGTLQQSIADWAVGPEVYELGAELLKPRTIQPLQVPSKALQDYINERMVGTDFIPDPEVEDSKKLKPNLSFVKGLETIFNIWCPSRSAADPNCEIASDQVQLYAGGRGATALASKVVTDFWNSSSSWMPPEQKFNINMSLAGPSVQMVHYHVNPLLHMIHGRPEVFKATATAMAKPSPTKIADFIRTRGQRVLVTPMYDFDPTYRPSTHLDQLLYQKLRIRMISDLDRLELVAINAGFIPVPGGLGVPGSPPSLETNAGLELIRDMGLAYGDVPPAQWPPQLTRIVGSSKVCTASMIQQDVPCIKTLKQANQHVKDTLIFMEGEATGWLGRIGRILFPKKVRLDDMKARIYNLKALLQLLDEEMPDRKGGAAVLRDMFYSIYSSSPANVRDQFSSGMTLSPDCIRKPKTQNPNTKCQFDSLDMLVRITRLGLFHHLGVNAAKRNQSQENLLRMLDSLLVNEDQTNKIFNWITSPQGLDVIHNLFFKFLSWEHGATAAEKEMMLRSFTTLLNNLNQFSPSAQRHLLTLISNSNLSDLAKLISKTDVLFTLLTKPQSLKMVTLTRAEIQKLEAVLMKATPPLVQAAYDLVDQGTNHPQNLYSLVDALDDISLAPQSKPTIQRFIAKLAEPTKASSRQKISDFVRAGNVRIACDAFTDVSFFNGTLTFLDTASRSGSLDQFLDEMESALSIQP